ncbi:MAG: hypothetical protein ACOZAL_03450 [Patescibacteria group bacterium]
MILNTDKILKSFWQFFIRSKPTFSEFELKKKELAHLRVLKKIKDLEDYPILEELLQEDAELCFIGMKSNVKDPQQIAYYTGQFDKICNLLTRLSNAQELLEVEEKKYQRMMKRQK